MWHPTSTHSAWRWRQRSTLAFGAKCPVLWVFSFCICVARTTLSNIWNGFNKRNWNNNLFQWNWKCLVVLLHRPTWNSYFRTESLAGLRSEINQSECRLPGELISYTPLTLSNQVSEGFVSQRQKTQTMPQFSSQKSPCWKCCSVPRIINLAFIWILFSWQLCSDSHRSLDKSQTFCKVQSCSNLDSGDWNSFCRLISQTTILRNTCLSCRSKNGFVLGHCRPAVQYSPSTGPFLLTSSNQGSVWRVLHNCCIYPAGTRVN